MFFSFLDFSHHILTLEVFSSVFQLTRARSVQAELLWSIFVCTSVRHQMLKKPISFETIMAKFNETSQEASMGVPLQKYNKGSRLINNNEMANFMFWLKKNISKTTSPNSMKLYRKLHCMTPWPTFLDLCL